jgi:hypothetical protein
VRVSTRRRHSAGRFAAAKATPEVELAPILSSTEVWFIHGNHDTDSDADHKKGLRQPRAHTDDRFFKNEI